MARISSSQWNFRWSAIEYRNFMPRNVIFLARRAEIVEYGNMHGEGEFETSWDSPHMSAIFTHCGPLSTRWKMLGC